MLTKESKRRKKKDGASMSKRRLTIGAARVEAVSPAELRLEVDPAELIDTRGWVGSFAAAVVNAAQLLEAAQKGLVILWTGHYSNANESGFHSTVLIPPAHVRPEWAPAEAGKALYIGSSRVAKLIPRRKPVGESVGLRLTPTQALELAGLLLIAAARLEGEGRKFVCVTAFATHRNAAGIYVTVTLE